MQNFASGSYEFEITGSVGSVSDSARFILSLVDPCPSAQLTLNEVYFTDMSYTLRDPSQSQTWDISNILTTTANVDCGPVEVEFFDLDTQDAIDSDVFFDDRSGESYALTVLETQDVSKKGIYNISYRAYFTNYSGIIAQAEDAIVITIIDPCDSINDISSQDFEDQTYTITDDAVTYQIEPFTVDPSWCEI